VKKNILITTGIYPPSAGGPATHAKNLFEYFSENYKTNLFVFEKYNKYPSGIRHILSFLKIWKLIKDADITFALDGFSVALPTVLAGKLCNKKVFLRIGGDFVHENYVEKFDLIPMDEFYIKLKSKEIKLDLVTKLKLSVQKYVLENADGIIYTTNWQKDIYNNFYNIKPDSTFIFANPTDLRDLTLENGWQDGDRKTFFYSTRKVKFKNLGNLHDAFDLARITKPDLELKSKNDIWGNIMKEISLSMCYVNTSISDISPNQVLEALAIGTPIICTKNTGIYDELKDVVRFIDPQDVQDIKNAMLEMSDVNIRNEYVLKIKNWKNKNKLKTWQNLFSEYENLIEKICK
jgi:glycosyltransferase involved in cell wall biosynthesis